MPSKIATASKEVHNKPTKQPPEKIIGGRIVVAPGHMAPSSFRSHDRPVRMGTALVMATSDRYAQFEG